MLTNIRTFALLMLTAGLALGVFAGSLIASPEEQVLPISRIDAAVQVQLEQYQEAYELDVEQVDRLRHELVRYWRALYDLQRSLMESNQDKFDALSRFSQGRIQTILDIKPDKKADPGK